MKASATQRISGGVFGNALPAKWRVEYCSAQASSWKHDWVSKLLWECISPGTTALFLALTGVWYFWKMESATDEQKKIEYKSAALSFLLWGLFNGVVYWLLVWFQNTKHATVLQ